MTLKGTGMVGSTPQVKVGQWMLENSCGQRSSQEEDSEAREWVVIHWPWHRNFVDKKLSAVFLVFGFVGGCCER